MEVLFFEKEVFVLRGVKKRGLSRRHQGTKEEGLKTFCHKGHIEHREFIFEFQIHILLWVL